MKYTVCMTILTLLIFCPPIHALGQESQQADTEKKETLPQQDQQRQKIYFPPDEHATRVARIFVQILNSTDIEHKVGYYMIKGTEPRAFAAPLDSSKYKFDYVVAVSYSMCGFVENDDELAIVIGHELAHIAKGHIESTSTRRKIGAVLGALLSGAIGVATRGSFIPNLVGPGADAGGIVYSKEQENEADYLGILYTYKAGFNPEAGVVIWERFAKELPESERKSILSTHPASSERISHIQKTVEEIKADGLEKYSKAIELNPTHEVPYLLRASEYLTFGRYEEAIQDCDKVIELDQNSNEAYFTRAKAFARLKRFEHAIEDMKVAANLGSKPAQFYLTKGIVYW